MDSRTVKGMETR